LVLIEGESSSTSATAWSHEACLGVLTFFLHFAFHDFKLDELGAPDWIGRSGQAKLFGNAASLMLF
jgi:hypothetical protein